MNLIFVVMTAIYVMTDYHIFSKQFKEVIPKKYSSDILFLLNEYNKIISIADGPTKFIISIGDAIIG